MSPAKSSTRRARSRASIACINPTAPGPPAPVTRIRSVAFTRLRVGHRGTSPRGGWHATNDTAWRAAQQGAKNEGQRNTEEDGAEDRPQHPVAAESLPERRPFVDDERA